MLAAVVLWIHGFTQQYKRLMVALFLLKATAVCLIKFISCGRNRNARLPSEDLRKKKYSVFNNYTKPTRSE